VAGDENRTSPSRSATAFMPAQSSGCQTRGMDIKDTFLTTNSALTDLVAGVRAEHLKLAMPPYARLLDDQTVRTTLNIMAYENECVPRVLAGETGLATNPEFKGDLLGDDLAGNYRRLGDLANEAVRGHDDLERVVHISYGDVPAGRYLSDISLNRAMTLFDLAALTGLEPDLPDDAIESLQIIAAGVAGMLRQMGIFPPEVQVSASASPEDRFLAFIGRQPRDRTVLV
jgi:uncharacterized protein (TIGR03086 family)